eukprot:3940745-Rhodomonas_salina.29
MRRRMRHACFAKPGPDIAYLEQCRTGFRSAPCRYSIPYGVTASLAAPSAPLPLAPSPRSVLALSPYWHSMQLYLPTPSLRIVRYWHSVCCIICLRPPYAMSGTEMAAVRSASTDLCYAAIRCSGTDLCYAATKASGTDLAMPLPGPPTSLHIDIVKEDSVLLRCAKLLRNATTLCS